MKIPAKGPREELPGDPIEGVQRQPASLLARWWLRIAVVAFASLVGGRAWQAVPADWQAGRHALAMLEGALVALVFYAWLRLLLQIWRGQRAAAEERAQARQQQQARNEELAARARRRD